MITPGQLKAARALAGLDQAAVAKAARVSVVTVKRAESTDSFERVGRNSIGQIREALETAGIEFMVDGVKKKAAATSDDAERRYERLRAVTAEHARFFRDREILTDADLYDENGLPS
jgi:transcriptional regulator with XRE-family HTH domain